MVKIIFESHSTTFDNESGKASGWLDVGLSNIGKQQALDLGKRYQSIKLNTVYVSDLQRSYETAELAFDGRNVRIIRDARLRECNYGLLSGSSLDEINRIKTQFIQKPFPSGESYEDAIKRIGSFLIDLLKAHSDGVVMIIGHRATQYGLEYLINKTPLLKVIEEKWKWQPGWTYQLPTSEVL